LDPLRKGLRSLEKEVVIVASMRRVVRDIYFRGHVIPGGRGVEVSLGLRFGTWAGTKLNRG
jgi:hypothetical protein